ncbi:MAG: GNAT family N-acetyltransferase [Candidatus Heimdallarchaeota archaeon]
MQGILKEIIRESINYYIEKNLDDFYIKSSEHPNFNSSGNEKVSWILALNADWPDGIFRVNFEDHNIKREIKKVRHLIKVGIAPNAWTVGPLSKPKNLGAKLEKYGFSNVYHQAGMAVELEDLKNKPMEENKLIIQKVQDEESLNQWSDVVSEVFNLRTDFDHLNFLLLKKEVQFYLGYFEKKPVSALLLYLSSGVAGLHAVSTIPEYRNRGFGLSINRSALIDAFNMGFYIGVLQASSLGEKVYRKLGFQKYCDINTYALPDNLISKNSK